MRPDLTEQPANTRRIASEIPCVNCGHLLTGLMPQGTCPECGQPVRWSLHGHGSRFGAADGYWLRNCYLGAVLATQSRLWFWFPPGWLAIIAAVWLLTSRNPATDHSGRILAWLVRLGAILGYLALSGFAVLMFLKGGMQILDAVVFVIPAAYAISHVALTLAARRFVVSDNRRWVRFVRAAADLGALASAILLAYLVLAGIAGVIQATGGAVSMRLLDLLHSIQRVVLVPIAAVIAIPAVPAFWILLGITKRNIDAAVYQSDDFRTRVRAWNPWKYEAEAGHPGAPASAPPG